MSNMAALFKQEIARIARKETRRLVEPLRKQLAGQRQALTALKGERDALRRELKSLNRHAQRNGAASPAEAADDGAPQRRFSATGLRALRSRWGISAEDVGRLLGVSGQSIYNWEQGKTRPRPAQVQAIAGLRGIGKRELSARLEELAQAKAEKPTKRKKRKQTAE